MLERQFYTYGWLRSASPLTLNWAWSRPRTQKMLHIVFGAYHFENSCSLSANIFLMGQIANFLTSIIFDRLQIPDKGFINVITTLLALQYWCVFKKKSKEVFYLGWCGTVKAQEFFLLQPSY